MLNKNAFKDIVRIDYDSIMNSKVQVDIGEDNILLLPHTRSDLLGLQFNIDNSVNNSLNTIVLEGVSIPVSLAQSLLDLGKKVNSDLYIELWRCYNSIDSGTDEEILNIKFTYDIGQIFVL